MRILLLEPVLFSSGLADLRYSPSRPEGQVAHAPQEIWRCTVTSFLLPVIPFSMNRLTLILLMFSVYVASIERLDVLLHSHVLGKV